MSSSHGAKLPTALSSNPGRPNMAAPIIPLRARKAAPQTPTSRRVDPGFGSSSNLPLRDQPRGERRVIGQDAGSAGPLEREQRFQHQRVALPRAGRGGSFDHRIFSGHLISEGRYSEPV